jgi:hypothetical protein
MLTFKRGAQVNEMLTSKGVRLIHKFSIVFPAHVVATVMCTWFLIAFLIVGLLSQYSADKIASIESKVIVLDQSFHEFKYNRTYLSPHNQ